MNKFLIPTHLLQELNKGVLDDICIRSINSTDFVVEEDFRGHNSGQYIKLITDDVVKYICLSRDDSEISRNSFILQNLPSAYKFYLKDTSEKKEFEYYVRDTVHVHPAYTVFAYKVLLTAKIKILNLDKVKCSGRTDYDFRTPFLDFKQMRKMRLELQKRNGSNNSTLFEQLSEEVAVYGKTYGANGRETTAICLALVNLVDLPIKVYNVNETDPQHLASVDPANRYILNYLGVIIDDGIKDLKPEDKELIVKRNTNTYHYNLLKKYQDKKCYICGCDIEELIIASHIHRVADILRSDLTAEEKQEQIVDGNNGFWLCATHDKLFEDGLIYFENDELKIRQNLSESKKRFIKKSIFEIRDIYDLEGKNLTFTISPEHYNEKMHYYLEIHRHRTEKLNVNRKEVR